MRTTVLNLHHDVSSVEHAVPEVRGDVPNTLTKVSEVENQLVDPRTTNFNVYNNTLKKLEDEDDRNRAVSTTCTSLCPLPSRRLSSLSPMLGQASRPTTDRISNNLHSVHLDNRNIRCQKPHLELLQLPIMI